MNLRTVIVAALTMVVAAPAAHADISHAKLGSVLGKYVSGGKVDYVGLRADQTDLDEYLKSVAGASTELKMSFYINAYNALVLKTIVSQVPLLRNVTDDPAFFDRAKHKVAGKDMTLNEIEGKIRKEYKDARVHFAFYAGARSSPPLHSAPLNDKTIDATLTKLTQNFFDGNGVRIDDTKREIQFTKLVDWYAGDFAETLKDPAMAKDKAAIEFAKMYLTDQKKRSALDAAVTADYKVTYQAFNWNPNAK